MISVKYIKFRVNDCEIVSLVEVVNVFNIYFFSIGNNLIKLISIVEKLFMEYLCNLVCDLFFIYLIIIDEIENEIFKLKLGKVIGFYSILVDILKLLKFVLFILLKIFFNNLFLFGNVLNVLKLFNVIFVFKKGF